MIGVPPLAWSLAACALVATLGGCRKRSCEELVPVPLPGSYLGGADLGEERLVGVSAEATSDRVVLRYRTLEGARIRATYEVTRKRRVTQR